MTYHVAIESSEGWYAARVLEDDSCYSQGKTLEEAVVNIREVIELVCGERKVELEVIIPASLKLKNPPRRRVRS